MADLDFTLRRRNGAGYDVLLPTTTWTQVENKPTTFTPTAHTHGQISNTGAITAAVVTPGNTDTIVITDTSDSGILKRGITIGTGTTTFLRNDGTWATPADSTTLTGLGITATAAELNVLDGITATTAELNFTDGVTSNIQTQLNGKSNTDHVHAINDVANLQTTLDGKQATITGAATTITGSNLTAFRVLGSDVSGKVAATSITTSTLAFLDATSSVQTQLNGKAATSHTHGNITSAGAIGSTANLGVVTTTSGVLTTRTINDSSVLAVLSNSSTALTTERDVYWGTRYIHLGVTSVAGNGVSRTITFTAGMRNFILQLHQDTTTGAVIARLPLTISNSSGTSTVTSVQSLDTFSRTHRVAWSNGGGAQILNVTISYSGTTITVSQNFNFNCAFRLFGF